MAHSNNRETTKSILLVKKCLELVEMTSGPVSASFSLPEWQAVKMIFFAPWGSLDEVHLTTLIPLFTILFNGLAA